MLAHLALLVLFALAAAETRADVLHLTTGSLEGEVLEEDSELLRLKTFSGQLAVPVNTIVRRVPGVSRRSEYEALLDQAENNAAAEIGLARWCQNHDLPMTAEHHVQRALELDPAQVEARGLAGYVLVGGTWIKTVDPAEPMLEETAAKAVIETLVGGWQWRVRTIHESQLTDTASPAIVEKTRLHLLSFREPLLLPGACRILMQGGAVSRQVLAAVLSDYEHEFATRQLLLLALVDADAAVRQKVAAALARRPDPRIGTLLRLALKSDSEAVIRRAAQCLGWMGDRSALGPLVDALPVQDTESGGRRTRRLFDVVAAGFASPLQVPLEELPVAYLPGPSFPGLKKTIESLMAQGSSSGSYRTEVQDALILLTGQNLGFDVDAWRDWIARNPPIDQAYP